MKRIGFVTSEEDPNLTADDLLAFPALAKLGISVVPVIWDKNTDFANLDALIFRSCWNYHRKYEDFLFFLTRVGNLNIPVFNSVDTIAWNLNKKHIIELENKILVPKTSFFEKKKPFSLDGFGNAEQIVIKPAVSLNGHDTYLLPTDDLNSIEKIIQDLLMNRDVLVQEYIPEIKTNGEISLVYFNKKYSHAIRKTPARNEFRVHAEYGGTCESIKPDAAVLAYGQAVFNEVTADLLYARVDVVESQKGPVLIELELTDPMLFLNQEHAIENFANAVAEVLS